MTVADLRRRLDDYDGGLTVRDTDCAEIVSAVLAQDAATQTPALFLLPEDDAPELTPAQCALLERVQRKLDEGKDLTSDRAIG